MNEYKHMIRNVKLISKIVNGMNAKRTSVRNQSSYDATSSMVLVSALYLMSLAKNYGCMVTISGGEEM
jgi:hypothetical protein